MSKIYFSRSISRTMSADHPVGDPTGGAAYGEKNDPISAAFSIAAMYGSAGAMMTGSIVAGITFAGAAMSLVGSVTGNKTLSKIGMITGIAGGIGQLAQSQGWISKTATLGETFGVNTTGSTAGNAAQAMSSSSLNQTTPSSAPSPNVQGANVNPLQQSSNAEFVNNENLARSGPIPPNLGTSPPIQNNMPV